MHNPPSRLMPSTLLAAVVFSLALPITACDGQQTPDKKTPHESRMTTNADIGADTETATAADIEIQQVIMYMTGRLLPLESLRDIQHWLAAESISFETFATELLQTKPARQWFVNLLLTASQQRIPTDEEIATWLRFYEEDLAGDFLALVTTLLDDPRDLVAAKGRGMTSEDIIRAMASTLSRVFLFFANDHDRLADSLSPAAMHELILMADASAAHLSVRVLIAVMPEMNATIHAWTADSANSQGLQLSQGFAAESAFGINFLEQLGQRRDPVDRPWAGNIAALDAAPSLSFVCPINAGCALDPRMPFTPAGPVNPLLGSACSQALALRVEPISADRWCPNLMPQGQVKPWIPSYPEVAPCQNQNIMRLAAVGSQFEAIFNLCSSSGQKPPNSLLARMMGIGNSTDSPAEASAPSPQPTPSDVSEPAETTPTPEPTPSEQAKSEEMRNPDSI